MKSLDPAQRRALRARAHHLGVVVTIGHHGLTPQVLHEIDLALLAHELVKVRVFGGDRDARESLLERICAELDCAPVQHLGKILILWRENPELRAQARERERIDKRRDSRSRTPGRESRYAGKAAVRRAVPGARHRTTEDGQLRDSHIAATRPRRRRGALSSAPPVEGSRPSQRHSGPRGPLAAKPSLKGPRQRRGGAQTRGKKAPAPRHFDQAPSSRRRRRGK